MKFTPEKYAIPDEPMKPFIDTEEINDLLENTRPQTSEVRRIIRKSLAKNRLNLAEVAALANTTDPGLVEEIKQGAQQLKEKVYGERIVLFAPLYVGNHCVNDCKYCGFRASNREAVRTTLEQDELVRNVEALEDAGQKRLILVYGEHPKYSPEYIAENVKAVYGVKKGPGEIRRVNINAAPFDIEGFRTIAASGIGTYQVFQETYHPESYANYHPRGKKSDYEYRLTALDRAQEAGQDDVGIGALFGLYDWRFEVLALVRHTNHLEACYNVGPHTISFPRLQDASSYEIDGRYSVSDEDFTKLVAILRLAVPYTGLILTAREPEHIRREVLRYGCSQIDAGTKIEMGAYAGKNGNLLPTNNNLKTPLKHDLTMPAGHNTGSLVTRSGENTVNQGLQETRLEVLRKPRNQDLDREQFLINDNRSLNEVMDELLDDGYLPSFCTACYRLGRTGEHFMEFSVPGFIKKCCTPNALMTLAEYLEDYAPGTTAEKGWRVINRKLESMSGSPLTGKLSDRLERIRNGERDLYF